MKELSQELILEKLKEGEIISDYNALLDRLEIPRHKKTSNSGKAFIKELKRFVNFKTKGRQYIILDIYDTPLEKQDGRKKGNNSIYTNYIEAILLYYLAQSDKDINYYSQYNLITMLGMANQDYRRLGIKDLNKEDIQVKQWELDEFNRRSWYKLSRIIETSLKNLENRSLIKADTEYVIVTNLDEHYVADEDEVKTILEAERYIMLKNNYYNKALIALTGKNKEFYSKVNDYLLKEHNWKYYYKRRKIISISNDYLKQGMEENLIAVQKLLLNEKIIDALNREAENKTLKIQETFKYPSYYLDNQEKLTQRFININEGAQQKYFEMKEEEERESQELDALFD